MVSIRSVFRRWLGGGRQEATLRLAPAHPAEPIPIGSDAETSTEFRGLMFSATCPGASADELIRGDAILKASVDLRVRHVLSTIEEPVACRKGCAHCCQNSVSAFPFEVFPIAERIRSAWTVQERRGLIRRLRAYRAAVTKPKPGANHPLCPFLREGSCSIYDVRPAICRTHHSSDLAECLRDPSVRPASAQPFYDATLALFDGAFDALGSRAGFPEGLEMALAVEIALHEEDALDRFLAGEDPFAAAHRRRIASTSSSYRRRR